MASYKLQYSQPDRPRAEEMMVFPFTKGQWEPREDVKDTCSTALPLPVLLLLCVCLCVCMHVYRNVLSASTYVQTNRGLTRDKQCSQESVGDTLCLSGGTACFVSSQADDRAFPLAGHWACVSEQGCGGHWRLQSSGLFSCGPCRPTLLGISTCIAAKCKPGLDPSLFPVVLKGKHPLHCKVEMAIHHQLVIFTVWGLRFWTVGTSTLSQWLWNRVCWYRYPAT